MRLLLSILISSFIIIPVFSQTIPDSRSTDWTIAGLRDTSTSGFLNIEMAEEGVIGDSLFSNDSILAAVISSVGGAGAILQFPEGKFLFEETISLNSNIVIKGKGAEATTFVMNLGGTGNAIEVYGSLLNDTTAFSSTGLFDSTFINVNNASSFSTGDWIQIIQNDSDLVSSPWALRSVGQIVLVSDIKGNRIELSSPLRMQFNTNRNPFIRKLNPVSNVGIECLKIQRIDNTAPMLFSNIRFNYAVNCWISGIESYRCTYSHIDVARSSNIYVTKSYFHRAFGYGSGGRAYGVMLESTSNECLIENNIFQRLRHSMILQSGANGNVFAYNYSYDPFWSLIPNDAAGDMVLHGNYPFINLFEQNICQNIVIDNSHGPSGPFNTFFRNRAESYGIFFSAANSPNQNLLGNEITNTSSPYSLVNYTLLGNFHLVHGNNDKGTIDPSGTETLPDLSYAYNSKPGFIPTDQWASIGTPNVLGDASIPALDRFESSDMFSGACGDIPSSVDPGAEEEEDLLLCYPNPFSDQLQLQSKQPIDQISIFNAQGLLIFASEDAAISYQIRTDRWPRGVYLVKVFFTEKMNISEYDARLIKISGPGL